MTPGSADGEEAPIPFSIILVAVFCVALIAVAAILIHMGKARSDFRKLSEMVEENATATAAPVETTPPETRSTGPTTETTVPTEPEPTEPVMLAKYAPLYEQNHDLFGWLRIDGTVIDYPVMHTPTDPEKYLHTNFAREYSYGGIPFIDANCSADSDNLLIYGHNMLDGSMFRSLPKYESKSYWQAHPTIHFDTLYEEGEYEVLAAPSMTGSITPTRTASSSISSSTRRTRRTSTTPSRISAPRRSTTPASLRPTATSSSLW